MEHKNGISVVIISILLLTTMIAGTTITGKKIIKDEDSLSRDFHDYTSLTTELHEIASNYPSISTLYNLGLSVQGRTIWGLKITDNPDIEENEVELRYCGCHHGNEEMSVELPLLLAWDLVENYTVDPDITDYVDNREIWIIPMVNPDGREMVQRRNANNVDLNRDYGYMWSGAGSSPSPFSQPETQTIREHALDNNIVLSYSYHTPAEYVNYLWNYKPQPTPDEPLIMMISEAYGDYSGLIPINGFDWYQITGDTNDFSYGCYGGIDTTIETLNSDVSFEWGRNRDAMLYALDVADMGLSGIVTDASTGDPLAATIWVEENYWPCYTDPKVGDYHKMLLPGFYNIHFRANGYQEQVKQINIVDANATNILNAQLVPGIGYYGYQVTMCEYFDYTTNPSEGISALGPPDNVSASLGDGGMMVIDMGNTSRIIDGDGDDFTVYEGDDTAEGYDVYVSNTWNGPWSSLGSGLGTTSFNLEDVGLDEARFVKIEDDGTAIQTKDYPGFDLDAIQADDPFTPEHDILVGNLIIDDVVAHGETQTVSATVTNIGNNTEDGIIVDFKVDGFVEATDTVTSLNPMQSQQVSFLWDPAIGTYLVAIESRPITDEYTLVNNNVNKTVDVIAAPAIDVSPSSFSFMVPTDSTDDDTLTIFNLDTAEAALDYSIGYGGDLGGSWLSADPETNTVAIDDSDIVTITVNTTGLSEGDYGGEIIITSNDLDDPEIIVTVDLTVVFGNDMAAIVINSPTGSISYGNHIVNATVQNMGFYPQTDVVINCSIFEGFLDYEEDFEAGDGDYVAAGGLWEYGTPTNGPTDAHSGDYCWGTDLDSSYGNDESATLDSPEIMLPTGVTANLSFWHWYETEDGYSHYDGGNVKVSTDGGIYWEVLGEYLDPYPIEHASSSNEGIPHEPAFMGDSSGWQLVSFDLTEFAGETVMLRWHFGSDGSVSDPGWYIDDVSIAAEYGRDDNLIYYDTETISLPAYESTFIEFNPSWNAAGGNYTIQVKTQLTGDENPGNDAISDVVFVTGPSLAYSPGSHNFGTLVVNDTDSTNFEIWNSGLGTLNYVLSETCSWVDVYPMSGDSSGEHDTINVDIDTTGLSAGAYHCDIDISSDAGDGIFGIDVYVVLDGTIMEDVNQSVFDRGFPIRHAVDGDWASAQSFTPTLNTITGADVYLRKFGTPEFDLTIELRTDDPQGTLIDSIVFTPAEIDTSYTWLFVDFVDTAVVPGTDYFIVCPPAPSGVTTSFGYEWGYAFGNQYDDGAFWFTRDGGTLWRDLPTMYELTFRTYGINS